MVSKAKKLLDKLRQTKRNWNYKELTTILEGAGFEWRDSGHRVFRHPKFPEIGSYPIPRSDGLPPAYAKDVLKLVEDAISRYQAEKKDDEK